MCAASAMSAAFHGPLTDGSPDRRQVAERARQRVPPGRRIGNPHVDLADRVTVLAIGSGYAGGGTDRGRPASGLAPGRPWPRPRWDRRDLGRPTARRRLRAAAALVSVAYTTTPPRKTALAPGTSVSAAITSPPVKDSATASVSRRSCSSGTRRAASGCPSATVWPGLRADAPQRHGTHPVVDTGQQRRRPPRRPSPPGRRSLPRWPAAGDRA